MNAEYIRTRLLDIQTEVQRIASRLELPSYKTFNEYSIEDLSDLVTSIPMAVEDIRSVAQLIDQTIGMIEDD